MNVVSTQSRLLFALGFHICLVLLLVNYYVIVSKHFYLLRVKRKYQNKFLDCSFVKENSGKKFWMLQYFSLIIISYAITSVVWGVNEVCESFIPHFDAPLLHSAALISYSLNFYFPSAVCIYLSVLEFMAKRGKIAKLIHPTYRFRDIY